MKKINKFTCHIKIDKKILQNISNEFSKVSLKGQIPFIELNGQQFADSNLIIDRLKQHFELTIDKNLTTREEGEARAFNFLIEESFFR